MRTALLLFAAILGNRIFTGAMYQIVNRLDRRWEGRSGARKALVDALWWLA